MALDKNDKNIQKQQAMQATAPQNGKRKGSIVPKLIAIVIVLLVAYFLLGYLSAAPTINVTGLTALTITAAPKVIIVNGTSYMISLGSYNSAKNAVYVYLNAVPPFINPEYNITLIYGTSVRVNPGNSSYATILLSLISGSSSSAKIDVSPIPQDLQEKPNYSYISIVNTSLLGYKHNQNIGAINTISVTTTTIAATSTHTTSVQTTTVNQNYQENQTVIAALEKGLYYPIMLNYSVVYANSRNCTSSLYNTTYKSYYGKAAFGHTDYMNTSALTPYSLNYSIVNYANGYSTVTYTATSHSAATTGVALTMNISRSSGVIVKQTIPLSGVYGGANATQLNAGLNSMARIGNACGVDVFSSS